MKNLTKAMMVIFLISLLFSCSENPKVRIFVSWPGGEGLPHYQWKKGEPKPIGIEPAFIERVLETASLEYKYVYDIEIPEEGDPRIHAITSEKVDICIRAFSITEERKELMLFTNPYYTDGLSALVRKEDSISSLEDLKGRRIYTLEFTSAHNWAQENLNESILMTYEKFDTAFIEPEGLLLNNKIDAYILDKSFLNQIAKNNPELEVLSGKFTEESIGIAVSKENSILVEKLNKAMDKLKETGEFDLLLEELK
ncbi:MAG: substrate-binding periplasmic protein [Flavobacteriales bacterium]